MTTLRRINHILSVHKNTTKTVKSVLLSFPFKIEYLLLLLVLLQTPPPPPPSAALKQPPSSERAPSRFYVAAVELISTANGGDHADASRRILQKSLKEFCGIDYEIIEATQQSKNQMNTNTVAIFIDDEFDLSENTNNLLRVISNNKAFVLRNIVSAGHEEYENGEDAVCCENSVLSSTITNANTRTSSLRLNKSFSIAIVQKSVEDLTDTFHIMMKNPSLVKIVLNYKECFYNNEIYESKVENFTEQLWKEHGVLHIYFMPFCWNSIETDEMHDKFSANESTETRNSNNNDEANKQMCFIREIFLYTAFKFTNNTTDMSGSLANAETATRGFLESYAVFSRPDTINRLYENSSLTLKSFNEFLQNNNKFNLNNMSFNVSFFPTTMAYLKADSRIFQNRRKRKNQTQLANEDVSTNSYYGTDIEIVKELARRLNFTPQLLNPTDGQFYGFRDANGTFTGALGDLLYGRVEIIMNAFFIKDYDTRDLEFTAAVYDDKMCFVVRSEDLIPDAWLVLKIFSTNVWIAVLLTFTVGIVFYAFIHRPNGPVTTGLQRHVSAHGIYERFTNQISMCFRIVGVLLSKPVNGIGGSIPEEFFVTMCLLWGLIITGTFQGSLIHTYTNPITFPNVNSMDGLDKRHFNVAIRFANIIDDLFGDANSGTPLGNLRLKTFLIDTQETIYDNLLHTSVPMAEIDRILNYRLLEKKYLRPNGVSLIHIVKECPKSYGLALLMRSNSVYLDAINSYLCSFAEFGLIDKWLQDTHSISELENIVYKQHSNDKIILNLKQLEIAFVVLVIGLVGAMLLFIIELCIR